MPIQESQSVGLESMRKGRMIVVPDEATFKRWNKRSKTQKHKTMLRAMMLEREAERRHRRIWFCTKTDGAQLGTKAGQSRTRAQRIPLLTYYHQAHARSLGKAKRDAAASRRR